MSTLRPELWLFVRAAATLINRTTGTGRPLSEEEASELANCLRRLEEFLRLDGHAT